MLPLICIAIVFLQHRRLPPEVVPDRLATGALRLAVALIVVTMSAFALMQLVLLKA